MELYYIRNLNLPVHELHQRLDDAIRAGDINAVYDAREEAISKASHLGVNAGRGYMDVFTRAEEHIIYGLSGQQGPAVVE